MNKDIATIYMLHRVSAWDNKNLFPNENMKISPNFLKHFIIEKKAKGFEFISLDALHLILLKQQDSYKKIVLTLDDGYADNYYNAYPIFKKYNIPFTIYVSTSFPDNTVLLWWYVLEALIIREDIINLQNTQVFITRTFDEKNDAFLKIRLLIMSLNQDNLLTELNELFVGYSLNWFQYNEKLTLTWDNIIKLSQDPLCTIGGHTVNHFVFNKLSEKHILNEVIEANDKIYAKTGKVVEHFSYPFGDKTAVSTREFDIVNKLNFKTSTTTRCGNIQHQDKLNMLPRIMLTDDGR